MSAAHIILCVRQSLARLYFEQLVKEGEKKKGASDKDFFERLDTLTQDAEVKSMVLKLIEDRAKTDLADWERRFVREGFTKTVETSPDGKERVFLVKK